MEFGDGAIDARGEAEVVRVDDETGRHGASRLILRESWSGCILHLIRGYNLFGYNWSAVGVLDLPDDGEYES